MWEWFKNQNVIIKSLIGIISAFILVCILIIAVIYLPFYSPISNGEWATVISTFFAGTLGGLIALGGIWWQLNHEKKDKRQNLKKYLNYIINKNSKGLIEKLSDLEIHFAYDRTLRIVPGLYEDKISYLSKFKEKYFDNNFDFILDLKKSEELITLNDKINNLNESFSIMFHNIDNKREAYEALEKDTTLSIVIEEYSKLLVSINNNMFSQWVVSLAKIKNALKNRKFKNVNESHLEELSKFVFELIEGFKEKKKLEKLEKLERLNMLVNVNKQFLGFIYWECININSTKTNELLNYVNYDLAHVDLALEIYNLIQNLNDKVE